ncbi:hypothetical protein DW322_11200 [Rhodococcus rhodnii]|uniref:Uncharacterized protein n=2 Tax=Rhodococcus rhodnii TaxID=38312 RepID=R7WRW5_9NOCA|nr:hypothetical protein [Rhodococcus rhodnii]EOM78051.1 hypothetical protein Rrhod_0592 [Rhodococcus rhodnii LMG 5362]TXG90678.1 hypothetical protein DW322_11200 [Rhodococcus rhodnii]
MTVRPCRHPRCDRDHGNPALTELGMCDPCQRHLHRLLGWLVLDWVNLARNLPTPTAPAGTDHRATRHTYGHPAEWASDTARSIADTLNEIHDALADHLGETPPPHPTVTDRIRVRAAWRYLEPRIHLLSATDWATDTVTELSDLHRKIRSRLGHTIPRTALPTPCPSCELRTLTRSQSPNRDAIECGACGWHIPDTDYQRYARIVLDTLVDDGGDTTSAVLVQ